MKFPKVDKVTDTPDDFMIICPSCKKMQIKTRVFDNFNVCLNCDFLLPRTSSEIITQVLDSFEPDTTKYDPIDPVNFKDYQDKQTSLRKKTGLQDAVITGIGTIEDQKFCIAVMDYRYIMGSLGSIVGTKLVKMIELATQNNMGVIIYTVSGGARMQEGITALMQMAKVVNALKVHSNKGLFYMPILTNPTTGGVTASFAQIGDIIIAEPGALICFAGPRVIKKTLNQELPDGFQRSEFLLEKGFLDKIVTRQNQKEFIKTMIKVHEVIDNE